MRKNENKSLKEAKKFIKCNYGIWRRFKMTLDKVRTDIIRPKSKYRIIFENKVNALNLCFFAHYDSQGIVKPYVFEMIEQIKANDFDIVFVSTSKNLEKKSIAELSDKVQLLIIREEMSFDFGSWAIAFDYLKDSLHKTDNILLLNDSIYGPFFDLAPIFKRMKQNLVWSMTDNYEMTYHLQSYFLFISKNVFEDNRFQSFWRGFKFYKNKDNIILHYEIGISELFSQICPIQAAFPYCKMKEEFLNYPDGSEYEGNIKNIMKIKNVNITHYLWDFIIEKQGFPFVKRELIKKNPISINNVRDFKTIISSVSKYDTQMITSDLL